MSQNETSSAARRLARPRVPSYLLLAAVAGAGLTAAFFVALSLLVPAGSYVRLIFTERGGLPYLATYMLFVALIQLGGVYLHLRREARDLAVVSTVVGEHAVIGPTTAGQVLARLGDQLGPSAQGLVVDRVRRAMHRIVNRGSTGDVAGLLAEQAEIDRAVHSSAYSLVRLIVMLLPIFGFIATVGGIGFSMAEFRNLFEKRGNEEVATLLGPITSNLGVAFDTTLLALILVSIVMCALHVVQKRGTELLNRCDEFCLDNLLGKVQGQGDRDGASPDSIQKVVTVLEHHLEAMEAKFEAAVGNVVSRLVENERTRWAGFTEAFQTTTRAHQEGVRAVGDSMTAEARRLAAELSALPARFRDGMKEQNEEARKLDAERARTTAQSLGATSDRIEAALARRAEQWTGACERIVTTQESSERELRAAMAKIEAVLHSGDELAKIQSTLTANLAAATAAGDVRRSLDAVGGMLERLSPILSELQKRRRVQFRIIDEIEGDSEPGGAAAPAGPKSPPSAGGKTGGAGR